MVDRSDIEGGTPIGAARQYDIEGVFASVWPDAALARARSILCRTMAAAERSRMRLYLDCGTLLGYVREGRILPWDDDIDLSMIGKMHVNDLAYQLDRLGLSVAEPELWKGTGLKVFDSSYGKPVTEANDWTWPNLDIFFLSEVGGCLRHGFLGKRFAGNPVFPGKPVVFETVECWAPERPTDMLDAYYKDWRTVERSHHLDHRREIAIETMFERPIRTDLSGRKHEPGDRAARTAARPS